MISSPLESFLLLLYDSGIGYAQETEMISSPPECLLWSFGHIYSVLDTEISS